MSRTSLGALPTHVAHAEWGQNRYFGFPVPELVGEETLTGLIAMAVGVRRLAPVERAVLDDIAVGMVLADPRVWPLKMARLVASYGGGLAGMAAALLSLEHAQIGHFTAGEAARLLLALREEAGETTVAAMLEPVGRRLRAGERLTGFGVPFRPFDERLVLVRKRIAHHGRQDLPHWRTMEAVIGAARQLRGLEPNVGLALGAACLDLGFPPEQISVLCVAICQTEFLSNAVEGSQQQAPVLRKLPDDRVEYVGTPARESPRAAKKGPGR